MARKTDGGSEEETTISRLEEERPTIYHAKPIREEIKGKKRKQQLQLKRRRRLEI